MHPVADLMPKLPINQHLLDVTTPDGPGNFAITFLGSSIWRLSFFLGPHHFQLRKREKLYVFVGHRYALSHFGAACC